MEPWTRVYLQDGFTVIVWKQLRQILVTKIEPSSPADDTLQVGHHQSLATAFHLKATHEFRFWQSDQQPA